MLTRSLFLFLLILLFTSCQSEKERLLSEGYQVFDAQKMALKCPCELKKKETVEGELKKFKKLQIWECRDDKTDLLYVFQSLPEKKQKKESEISDNIEELIGTLKKDAENVAIKTRKGHDLISVRYSEVFLGEVYVEPKSTVYLYIIGSNAGRKSEEVFSSVRFYE